MEPNLWFWRQHQESFLSRVRIWLDLLDPTSLLCSDAEIRKARSLIGAEEEERRKDSRALILALSSTSSDSGDLLPLVFRPPAFMVVAAPLVVASFIPHRSVKAALFWQFMVQSYCAGFNHANRNSSSEQSQKAPAPPPLLLMAGTVSCTTCAGAVPQIVLSRLAVRSPPVQTFLRSVLPIPLSAALAFFSVFTIRSRESETGIQVFDSSGNAVGVSKAAGGQAVRETALSRAAMFAAVATFPHLLLLLLRRSSLLPRTSLLVAPVRHSSAALALALMIPTSFSFFPQLGKIKREKLEQQLQAAAGDGHLFYHRGV